jgi:glutamate 5-kinase
VNAKRISEVTDIANLDLSTIGGAGSSGVGSGGMATKIEAARVVTKNSIPMLLLKLDQFDEAIADKDVGTFFAKK